MTQLGYGLLHHYKKRYVIILGIIISWLILVSVFHMIKPLSRGIDYTGKVREVSADNVSFLYDLTYNKGGTRVHEQHIFDKIFSYIQGAKKYILIDMFLFNSHLGNSRLSFRKISEELVKQLIDAKEREPNLKIDVITDPINILYGGAGSSEIDKLKKYGISVVITDLKSLRDSNPLYSSFWRTFIQWFGNSPGGWFPNPFSATGPRVSLRTYLAMINFKANHRKIFMADSGESYVSIIMSANPHDASSSHSNVALEVRGDLSQDLYITESGVASFSNMQLAQIDIGNTYDEDNELLTQLVTEKAIRKTILDEVGRNNLEELFMSAEWVQTNFPEDSHSASVSWELMSVLSRNTEGDNFPIILSFSRREKMRSGSDMMLEIEYQTEGYDDLISRGNGLVRLNERWNAEIFYMAPRRGAWANHFELRVFQEGYEDWGASIEASATLYYHNNLNIDFSLNPSWSRDWLIWLQGDQLASFSKRQVTGGIGASWFPAEGHEVRLRTQWYVINADAEQGYRIGSGGRLVAINDPINGFAMINFGMQLRYRYEIAPLSDLYLVYSRGGIDRIDDQNRSTMDLLASSTSLRNSDQFLVKLRYRF